MKKVIIALVLVFAVPGTRFGLSAGPPLISALLDQFVSPGESTPPIPFIIGSPTDPASSIIVVATSSNTNLVPKKNLTLLGSDALRQVIVTPAGQLTGTSKITITTFGSAGKLDEARFYIRVGGPIRVGPPTRSPDGQISVRVFGVIGDAYDVLASTNLVDWSPTWSLTNEVGWVDYAEAGTNKTKFYRARWSHTWYPWH